MLRIYIQDLITALDALVAEGVLRFNAMQFMQCYEYNFRFNTSSVMLFTVELDADILKVKSGETHELYDGSPVKQYLTEIETFTFNQQDWKCENEEFFCDSGTMKIFTQIDSCVEYIKKVYTDACLAIEKLQENKLIDTILAL